MSFSCSSTELGKPTTYVSTDCWVLFTTIPHPLTADKLVLTYSFLPLFTNT